MSRLMAKLRGHSSSDLNASAQPQMATEQPTVPSDGLRDVPLGEFLGVYMKSYMSALTHTHGNPSKVPYPMQYYLPKTYLSMIADFKMDHINLLNNAVSQSEPVSRFLAVLQYHISTINLTKFPYKPFFPRMGESLEVFTESAQHGQTRFVAEQLHTDPAFTAFHMFNKTSGITQCGTFEMCPSFKTSRVNVVFKGPNTITLQNFNEQYSSDWPTVSIYLAKAKTELSGTSTLSCTNGLQAVLTFDKERVCHGVVTQNGATIFELSGHWDSVVNITNSTTKESTTLIDRRMIATEQLHDPPFETLPPTSSQKLRTKLLAALAAKDYENAKLYKLELEPFAAQPHLFRNDGGVYTYIGPQ